MTEETYKYGAVIDDIVVLVEIKDTYMFAKADCFLFRIGSRDKLTAMLTQPKFRFDMDNEVKILESIVIDDLVGNGDGTGRSGKGYGKIAAQSCFKTILQHFSITDANSISVIGELSSAGDDYRESHYRRVRFWQNNGLTVKDVNDEFSPINGTLAGCINYPVSLKSFGKISEIEVLEKLSQ